MAIPLSTMHAQFTIERRFAAPLARVFETWSDQALKQAWSDCHAATGASEFSLDFRQGGRELHRVVREDGCRQTIEKVFLELTHEARITFAYYIAVDEITVSASLVTVEFAASGNDTRMRYHEYVVYFDGHGDHEQRIVGTEQAIDQLGARLAAS